MKRNPTIVRGDQFTKALDQYPNLIYFTKAQKEEKLAEGEWLFHSIGLAPLHRQEWSSVHGVREFIQNALDAATDNDNIKIKNIDVGDRFSLMISDNGPGIEVEHLTFGQFKSDVEKDRMAKRGRFGEGLKIGCSVMLREGKPVHINSVLYNFLPMFVVDEMQDPARDRIIEILSLGFFYKRSTRDSGTDIIIVGQEDSYQDLFLPFNRERIVFSQLIKEPPARAENLGEHTVAELVSLYDRPSVSKVKSPCLYIRDIYTQELDEERYTFSYNIAAVISPKAGTIEPEIQPNRDAIKSTAINYAITRLWIYILLDDSPLSEKLTKLYVDSLLGLKTHSGDRKKLAIKETSDINPFYYSFWHHDGKTSIQGDISQMQKTIAAKIAKYLPGNLETYVFVSGPAQKQQAATLGYYPVEDNFDWHGKGILESLFPILEIPVLTGERFVKEMREKAITLIEPTKYKKKHFLALKRMAVIVSLLYKHREKIYNWIGGGYDRSIPSLVLSNGYVDPKTGLRAYGWMDYSNNQIVIDWKHCVEKDPEGTTVHMIPTLMHEFAHWIRESHDGSDEHRIDIEATWHLAALLIVSDTEFRRAIRELAGGREELLSTMET